MKALLSCILFIPATLYGQLTLATVASDGTETATASVYGFGQVATGDNKDIRFRARNAGTASTNITALSVSGSAFSLTAPALPIALAAKSTADFTIRFTAAAVTSYSGTLTINSASWILLGTSVVTPTLTVTAPCLLTGTNISFANSTSCTFTVTNPLTQAMPVSPVTLSGTGFSGLPAAYANGVTLPASEFINFTLSSTSASSNGTLVIGVKTYTLAPPTATSPQTAPLSVALPCLGPDTNGNISFGTVASGSQISCIFTLPNSGTQPLTVSPLTLSGTGFAGSTGFSSIITIPANQQATFAIVFTGSSATNTSGLLSIGGRAYTLSASASFTPIVITSVASDGSGQETSLGTPATFNFGQVAAGDAKIVSFRLRSTTLVNVTTMCVAPPAALCPVNSSPVFGVVNSPTLPFGVDPANPVTMQLQFLAPQTGSYTGTLQLNGQTVSLSAQAVPGPTLTVGSPCSPANPKSGDTITFGRIQVGTTLVCQFSVLNPTTQALPVTISGNTFSGLPASIPAINGAVPIQVTFRPTSFNGTCPGNPNYNVCETLVIGPRSFTLLGAGFAAPLPKPSLTFDSSTIINGEQHTLTITLPTASTVTTSSGTLTMTFKPQASVLSTGISDDKAVQFVATGKRTATFSVTTGSAAVTINSQPNIVFSTGTTAGQITFTMDAGIFGFASDPTTTLTLAAANIAVTQTSATRKLGELDILVTGYDNTYAAGVMNFAFFDKNNLAIGSTISADFTSNFQKLYQGQTIGSSFTLGLAFPVTGDATQVGAVDVTLKNGAGSFVKRLTFP